MRFKVISLVAALAAVFTFADRAAALDTQAARKSVVRVISIGNGKVGTGTGFVINEDGNLITNHHVIANALSNKGKIKILTDELAERLKPEVEKKFGKRVDPSAGLVSEQLIGEILTYLLDKLPEARVQWSDPKLDLAVLNSDAARELPPLSLSPSRLVNEGQTVYALGYPGKSDKVGVTAFLTLKTLNGTVASKEFASSSGVAVYQTTAPFSGGNSGGPLVTECGEVIGINTFDIGTKMSGVQVGEAVRYSIQADTLISELDRQGINYKAVGFACSTQSSAMNLMMLAGLAIAMALALAAVIIASTQRGRNAVKEVSRKIYSRRSQPGPFLSPGMMPVLKGVLGEFADKTITLDEKPLVMGRDPRACQLVFPPSLDDVSNRHCALRYDAASGAFALEDLGSTNGTFVVSGNGKDRVAPGQARRINSNDRFYLGDPGILFEVRLEQR